MESIEKKQLYLRQKIIDAGHDAEEFIQYCSNQHGLIDLEDWPMHKLKTVVELFTKMKTKNIQKKNQQHNKHNEDDWGTFQTETHPVKIQKKEPFNSNNNISHIQSHSNATKTGHLVFSQADWDIFMGSNTNNPVPAVHQINIQQAFLQPVITKKNQYPSLDYNLQKQQNKSAQINLPILSLSLNQKSQTQIKREQDKKDIKMENVDKQIKLEVQGKDNPLSPPSQQIKKTNIEEKSPINLVNIKLSTTKAKPVPKLPQINDVHITKTQQISRNFLQSDYTLYYIHFTPGNHCIQRKFTDLRKLRTILQKIYPHIRLPYLQPEGWLNSSQGKDSQTLAKYKWMAIDFMKYIIIRNQQLKNSQIVRKFCGYSTNPKNQKLNQILSRQQLKKMLQGYQSFPRPKYIGQLCLNQNKIMIPPIKNGQKLLLNTNNLMLEVDIQYQKLRKQFQNLFYNYELISKSFVQITSTFQNLQNLIKKYNFDNNESKELRVYDGLRQMTNKMQNTINEQYIVFKSRLKNVFRFQKDNMNTLKQLFDSRNKIHNQYVKQGYPLLSSTNKANTGQLQVDSNISIDDPSRNNKNTLCVQEIFWSHVTKQEIRSYWEQLRKKINEQLTLIAYDELDNENDNLNFWNSVIKKCVV